MKLSVKSDYASRALLSLARHHQPGVTRRLDEIAQEQGIPSNYLVQILIELKSANLIESVRGKAGGYRLSRPPAQITFADLLLATHGALFDSPALTDEACPAELRRTWLHLRQLVETEASKITFQQLVESGHDPARMFYI